nr:lipid storage droplets surface-binding protein 1-like isoform X1 [Onthophagus taurus]XP_022919526.1 lipid storage droplets surface-binding protein 1-like isoform X2 [Onthophagus taurus]
MAVKKKDVHLPRLESVERITQFPIVESGWKYAENIYKRIKNSNNLFQWTLDTAENSIYGFIDSASPAVFFIEGPLSTVDKVLCKSLDIVEQRVPSINLPPQLIYYNTKRYVTDVSGRIVKPVLKRTNSVKQIGNAVLSSKYTAFAADKLDGALNVADKYVDKYLPADTTDGQLNDDVSSKKYPDGPTNKAIQTIVHTARFSRKLRRRLTSRTLAEARALKEQSAEAIHVLAYVAELVYTDPKLAIQKGKELWATLSKDEPENQARPETLEQLIVMLTRESARRIVHFVNFTSAGVSKLPRQGTRYIRSVTKKCIEVVNSLLKTVHLEGVGLAVFDRAVLRARSFTEILKQLNTVVTDVLEQLAVVLAQQVKTKETEKSVQNQPQSKIIPQTTVTNTTTNKTYEIRQQFETLQPPVSPKSFKATHNRQVANGVETVAAS